MKILAQSTDGVDILVGPILGECPIAAARKLEELDAKLFCGLANETWSGKRRFVMVKKDWRTILTLAGAVTFRRRYYLDRSTGRYTHPLDAAMGLCRYSRASADVRLKILDMAGECPYRYVGANAVPGQVLSKSTVCRIIRDTAVTSAKGKMDPGKSAVHVQIDEKYISMIGKKHKFRYITATIYAGKKTASGRNALTNRTLIPGVENGVVTLEHDTIKHEVKVNCLKAFAKKIVLTLYADSNPNVKGTMTFDFRERINVILPDSINLVEGQVPTVNPRVDTTGGTVTVDKNVTDVTYSWNPDFLAWVKEKSMKELNDYMTENQANMSFQGETFTGFVGLGAEDATGFFKKAFKANEFLTTKGGKYTWEEAYSDDDSEDPWSQCSSTWYLGSAAKTDFTSEFDGTKPVFDWTCKVNGVSYAKSFGLTLSSINVTSIALSGSNYCF